jgi:glycosyltransferase involved in cell wall biosynthesis
MKALVLSSVFPDPTQPTHGIFVLERVRHLAARADVRVVAPVPWFRWWRRAVPGREVRAGLVVVHPPFVYLPRFLKVLDGLWLFLSSAPSVLRLRLRFDFDLIDAHFAWPEGFAAILLGKLFRRPVCITLRGTLIHLSPDPRRRRLMAWALRRAARVVAVSRELADRAIEYGADPARVEVIANGVDAARFTPGDARAARRALGLAEDGRLVVSVGHLSPRKGFQRLLRVWPRLLERVPDARLAIVGGPGAEGDNGAQLREQAAALGLAERVTFAGARPADAIATWLQAGDVFALASDYEGCPNVVMEALACARPVVVSAVGEVRRMLPAHAGLVYGDADDDEALTAALVDALTRDWDTGGIRRHAEEQTWERVATRVLEQWRQALPGARPTELAGSAVGAKGTDR